MFVFHWPPLSPLRTACPSFRRQLPARPGLQSRCQIFSIIKKIHCQLRCQPREFDSRRCKSVKFQWFQAGRIPPVRPQKQGKPMAQNGSDEHDSLFGESAPDRGRRAAQHQGPLHFPQALPGAAAGLDRPGRRRPLLLLLRPGRGVPRPGPAHLPGRLPGPGHLADRLHHLLRLLAHHRAFPPWRRRLHRGHPHPGRQGRRPFRQRPAGRLHADHHRLHRRLRRRPVQLPARRACTTTRSFSSFS